MARIQMPGQDREMVLFLIGQHLELSAAMQSRDMFDPQTIRDVAHQVANGGAAEGADAADLRRHQRGESPTAMTPWRAEQLWQLYLKVYNELTRELETERIDDSVPAGSPERAAFLQGFPCATCARTPTPRSTSTWRWKRRAGARGMAVDVRRLDSAWQLTLIAHDRPGLFASVAGTLSCFGMNILKAEAFANRRSLVLDTFTFADPARTLDLNPSEVDRLRATVERVLTGKVDVTRTAAQPSEARAAQP